MYSITVIYKCGIETVNHTKDVDYMFDLLVSLLKSKKVLKVVIKRVGDVYD